MVSGGSLLDSLPGRLPQEWIDRGWLKTASTLEELAGKIGVDAEGLKQTVQRFNEHARRGVDPDFERGASASSRRSVLRSNRPRLLYVFASSF